MCRSRSAPTPADRAAIPAGFNGVVGVKPTVGRVSTRGVVPNCRSLDCVSIFARARRRRHERARRHPGLRCGRSVLAPGPWPQRRSAGNGTPARFVSACCAPSRARVVRHAGAAPRSTMPPARAWSHWAGRRWRSISRRCREAGRMLFDGPWIAERNAALALARCDGDLHAACWTSPAQSFPTAGQLRPPRRCSPACIAWRFSAASIEPAIRIDGFP